MKRREFLTFLAGAAVRSPHVATAQQSIRRIGMLMPIAESDPEGRTSVAVFEQGLAQLGWIVGRNVRIDYRWAIDSAEKDKAAVADFQALSPDVVVASTSRTVAELRQMMPTVPIVFTMIYDPVAQGFVENLAHPGGNATGLTAMEPTIGAKWLELLVEIDPALVRVAYMCNPTNPGPLQPYAAVETTAHNRAIANALAPVHGATDIETVMTTLAREPGGGLIVPPDGFLINHRKLIIDLAARYKLAAIYGFASFAAQGGLASYGVELPDGAVATGCSLCRSYLSRRKAWGSPGTAADPIRIGH